MEGSMSKYLEFQDKDSSKFWEVSVVGKKVTVNYGKIGTNGQSTVKEFSTPTEAKAHAEKATSEKLKKGYKEARK
jgi:predicted DNA-binding WGR domain protein